MKLHLAKLLDCLQVQEFGGAMFFFFSKKMNVAKFLYFCRSQFLESLLGEIAFKSLLCTWLLYLMSLHQLKFRRDVSRI